MAAATADVPHLAVGFVRRVRVAVASAGAALLGAAPHLMHLAGPLAGAALFTGLGGTVLFGALGLLACQLFLLS